VQEFLVSYRPTCLTPGDEQLTFRVGGERDTYAAIIEEWKVQAPMVGQAASLDAGTQEWTWQLHEPLSVKTLFEGSVDEGAAECIATYPGAARNLIVKFYSTGNVYLVSSNALDSPPQLIASQEDPDGSGAFWVPELAQLQSRVVRFRHEDYGFVFLLTQPSRSGVSVVLYDQDLNGTIDGFISISTVHDWVATGLSDGREVLPLRQ
jgi:hypothetical protein